MAENSFTYNLDEILSSTLLAYRTKSGKFYDNIFKANPTFYALHEKGRRDTIDGGERITVPLQYAKNSTVTRYHRYSPINITPQDNETSAYYQWKQMGDSIIIDGLSLRQNSGKHQLINLLKHKTTDAEMSLAEEINADLWRCTPLTDGILSIPSIVVPKPSSVDGSTPGNIDGTSKSYWRNQTSGQMTSAITTWKIMKIKMNNMYNTCSKGAAKNGCGGFPDLIITNQESFEYYDNYMDEKSRYISPMGQKAVSVGFQNFTFKNADMFWDEHVPDAYGSADDGTGYDWDNSSATYGSMYFLNSQFLYYYVDKVVDLKITPFEKGTSHGQDARVALILHMHQLACSNRSKHGIIYGISKSLTS